MDRSLPLSRVLSLVSGLALLAAFFMPWFASQGLLLSGQFLHSFLANSNPADLRRFLPTSSPTEIQLLKLLVDAFPACGAIAGLAALIAGLTRKAQKPLNAIQALTGLIPLIGWAGGITRLPPGSSPEIGLYVIALGAVGILLGVVLALLFPIHAKIHVDLSEVRSTSL